MDKLEILKEMPDEQLLSALDAEKVPGDILLLVDEVRNRNKEQLGEGLIEKYRHDYPLGVRVGIMRAVNRLKIKPSEDFLECILRERDISDLLVQEIFIALRNLGLKARLNDIYLFHPNRNWRQIAIEVYEETEELTELVY